MERKEKSFLSFSTLFSWKLRQKKSVQKEKQESKRK